MSSMRNRLNQAGEMNILLLPLVFMTLFFLAAAGFGAWAYTERQDYKLRSDEKVAAAVEEARRDEGIKKDKVFAEAEKSPLKPYQGPEAYGGVKIKFPKTWSTYVHSTQNGQPINVYFHKNAVPSVQEPSSVYALRIQVLQQSYSSVVKNYEGFIKNKSITAEPFAFPEVPDVIGLRLDGQVKPEKKSSGTMIVMPLRDKTLEVWTESPEFKPDFNKIIIPNLTFSP